MLKTKFLLITFMSLTIVGPAHGMLKELTYQPWEQAHNPKITEKRLRLSRELNADNFTINNKTLPPLAKAIVVRNATKQEKNMRCFGYAIAQITGSTTPIVLERNPEETSFNIKDFFDQTNAPQDNDLAVYISKQGDPHHFGCFRVNPLNGKIVVESKWGRYRAIIQHKLFAVPFEYRPFLTFWRLKPEFSSPEGKERLAKIIQVLTHNDHKKLKIYKSPQSQVLLQY